LSLPFYLQSVSPVWSRIFMGDTENV
jgi:hypothetical protein